MEVTDLDRDYGRANEDVPHKLAMNVVWELPIRFGNRALNAALGGWQLNALSIMQSGTPFTVICTLAYPRCDFNADGQNNDRVNLPAGGTDLGSPSQQDWLDGVLNADDFTNPAPGGFADQPRNAFRGPGLKNVDLSLFKNVALPGMNGRGSTLQIRVEAFNVFNWVNLDEPNGTLNNANFGRVTGVRGNNATGGPRVIQLGAKWMF
jgi:hypothetical protein